MNTTTTDLTALTDLALAALYEGEWQTRVHDWDAIRDMETELQRRYREARRAERI